MDYALLIKIASLVLFVMACLVFAVNIIVEVIKKVFGKLPTSLLAAAVSIAVTLLAFLVWASVTGFGVCWYHIAGALIFGMFVAYAAMFGFDKFQEAFDKLKSLNK